VYSLQRVSSTSRDVVKSIVVNVNAVVKTWRQQTITWLLFSITIMYLN